MRFFHRLREFLKSRQPKKLSDWFDVAFDEESVFIRAEPPGKDSWADEFTWISVVRVCFAAEDLMVSDAIYVFTSERPESYMVPTEAAGGDELWGEILRRNLFDHDLAVEAITSIGGLYCWPPEEQEDPLA